MRFRVYAVLFQKGSLSFVGDYFRAEIYTEIAGSVKSTESGGADLGYFPSFPK
jgi:hypothetical protein